MKTICSVICGFLGAAGTALAQAPENVPPAPAFDCWIGSDGRPNHIHYIRCIADRDIPPPPSANPQTDALMEQLHREFHSGSGSSTEVMFKSNIERIKEFGSVWSIRIYSYPYEWSWKEGMPERLVRAALCPGAAQCAVVIRKD